MIRTTIAGIGGFVLIFIESYIVMLLKGYSTIDFGGMAPFISVWAMNFFFLFSIFTHIKEWHNNREVTQEKSSI
ncbi:hypothetical protein [Robertmurraya andreesenii]|uniref:Uncharacterized protein n=1 Tax=Anoxybacillus andreesenii TaxID=1325932 RepID=A0ABT9V268_9BACL|nr:hypothetical protein [Robertmurraya andreesenii]MDQ0155046.1 hypothetical protein [Robertmurraya andreesenii]